jgi:ABC-type glycerol-3-phosphate transport system substrate-binding protein
MTLSMQPDFSGLVPKTRWDELGFFRFPVIDPDVAVGETAYIQGFVIPAKAPEPQAAMDFLAHQGSVEAQTCRAEQCGPLGGVPVRSDVDSAVVTPAMQAIREIFLDADEFGGIIFWIDSPMFRPVFRGGHFQSFFKDPATLDEILDELEAKRQEVFEE